MELQAESGNVDAMRFLAEYYYDGQYVERNYEVAYNWYLLAAQNGDVRSEYRLAEMLSEGRGTKKDLIKSIFWYMKAASQGSLVALDNAISLCVSEAIDDKQYLCDANDMLRSYAENGSLEAIRRIGNNYYNGHGVKKNRLEALQWYEKAARLGDQWCKNKVAEMYREGTDVPRDLDKATYWYVL